jgi:hypothetical protein
MRATFAFAKVKLDLDGKQNQTMSMALFPFSASLLLSAIILAQGMICSAEIPQELTCVTKKTTKIEAFQPVPEFDRHDPSNIIQFEGIYWVFLYT